jgi:hypothetical protein
MITDYVIGIKIICTIINFIASNKSKILVNKTKDNK